MGSYSFNSLLTGFTGFRVIIPNFPVFLLGLRLNPSFTGFYWVLLGFLGFTGLYGVLLGFPGFDKGERISSLLNSHSSFFFPK